MTIFNGNARSNVSIGTLPNDGTGDPLRTAFEKINNTFFDLYVFLGNGIHLGNVTNINIFGGNLTGVANIATANTVYAGNLSTPVIYHNSGTIDIKNNLNVVGDVDIDGGDLTFSSSTVNIGASPTTLRLGASASSLELGATSGLTTVRNALSVSDNITMGGSNVNFTSGTIDFARNVGTLRIGNSSSIVTFTNNVTILGDVVGNLNVTSNITTGNLKVINGIIGSLEITELTSGTIRNAVIIDKSPFVNVNLLGNVTGTGNVFLSNLSGNVINVTVTLENTGVTPTTYGSSRNVPRIIVDAKGRITSAANIAFGDIVLGTETSGDYVQNVIPGSGIVITGTPGESRDATISLGTSGVTAATYGSSRIVPSYDVDQFGRITRAANIAFGDIVLGTETSGAYVANLTFGNGITIFNLAGETATPNVQLTTTGVTASTYGNSRLVPAITVDQFGRLTSASNVAFGDIVLGTETSGAYVANLTFGNGITIFNLAGETATPNIRLTTTGVTAATYGSSRIVPSYDVDTQGRITRAANIAFGDIVLGTETSGAYVANLTFGNGIVITNLADETATPNVQLTTTGVTASTYGNSRIVPSYDVDQFGRITRAANIAFGDIVLGTETSGAYVANLTFGNGISITNLSGEGATPNVQLTTTGVTASTYGSNSRIIPIITVDQFGRITRAANTTLADIVLGTETSGAYVANLVAGTGVTLTGLGNEGTTPTIAIGQDVSTSANATFNNVSLTVSTTGGFITGRGGTFSGNVTVGNIIVTGATVQAGETQTAGNVSAWNLIAINNPFGDSSVEAIGAKLSNVISNTITTANLTVSRSVIISANLTVGSNARIIGNVDVGVNLNTANLAVSRDATITGNLTVSSNARIIGNVDVGTNLTTANVVVNRDATITGNITVGSNARIIGNVDVGTNLTTANLTVSGNARIIGNVSIGNNITVSGNSLFTGNSTFTSNIRVLGNVDVGVNLTTANLTVSSNARIIGNVDVGTNLTTANLTVSSNARIIGNVDVGTNLTTANLVVSRDASITGNITVGSNTRVIGNVDVGVNLTTANLFVSRDATITGNLSVLGNVVIVNTEQVFIEDNIVVLNSNSPATSTIDAGITVFRGSTTNANASILWNETSDRWEVNSGAASYIVHNTGRDVALGTETSGNYVQNVIPGSGIVITGTPGESRDATISLGTSGVTANTYGSTSIIPVITVDTFGRLTSVTNVSAATAVAVTGFSSSGNTFTISRSDGSNLLANLQVDSVRLGTDTTGSYVANLTFGNGISITNLSGENATPNIQLTTTGVTASTYGNSRLVPAITVDQFGRITNASNVALGDIVLGTETSGAYVANLTFGNGISITNLSGEGATPNIQLTTTGVTSGNYGNSKTPVSITVDQFGRVTSVSNVSQTLESYFQGYIRFDTVNQHPSGSYQLALENGSTGDVWLYMPNQSGEVSLKNNKGNVLLIDRSGLFFQSDYGNVILSNQTNSSNTLSGALQVRGGVGIQKSLYANAIYTSNLFYANGNSIIGLTTTGVTAANYGNNTHHVGLVIDSFGRITSANSIALAAGPQGVQGAVGAQGNQGVQGAVGAQGNQGVQGAVGAQGNQGVQGAVGAQGNQGVQGAVGAQGNQGVQGAVGAQGNQGVQGGLGVQGAQGAGGGSTGGSFANVASIISAAVTTVTSNIFTAPTSPADSRYIVYSLYVTNVDASGNTLGNVSASLGGENYNLNSLANAVPVPVGSAAEILKKPKIMKSGDYIQIQAQANSVLHASITHQTIYSDNTYFGAGVDVTSANTYTDLYVATGNAVSIESILLVNDDPTNDVKATIVYTDSGNSINGYYSYNLIVPNQSTIELLEAPKYLPLNYKLRVLANQANRLEAVISGRKV